MPFTEFCCRSGGSNLNAGTRTGSAAEPGISADLTYASGSWVASTQVFTVASGNPVSDGVAVGDFASVYANGSTVTGYVGRVSARTTTTITVDVAFSGTAPVDGTSNRTLKIGGAWKGPNAADGFPFTIAAKGMTNVVGDQVRVNLKNDAQYNVTASIARSLTDSNVTFQGYTTSYGDGGKATIDGGTTGASYILLNVTGGGSGGVFRDFILAHNGSTGSATGFVLGNLSHLAERIVVHDMCGAGISAKTAVLNECEVYACNLNNTANTPGIFQAGGGLAINYCISHDNAGSNTDGLYGNQPNVGIALNHFISESNGRHGVFITLGNDGVLWVDGLDAYANGGDGFRLTGSSQYPLYGVVKNSNFIKNGGFGFNPTNNCSVSLYNNGYGSGTQVNVGGATAPLGSVVETGAVTYAANLTPWVDPANGDFRINLATAKGSGRANFTETQSGYAGTVGYPDIGAAQHLGGIGSGLVAFDGMPLVAVGMAHRQLAVALGNQGITILDAANEAAIMVGQIFTEDGGVHTIDTTGASSLGWNVQNVTFVNAGSTVKVGLAAVVTGGSPPARAVNVSDVITFDVSKTLIGGAGVIPTDVWQQNTPDAGSKTIANGDTIAFCVQMTARGGSDSVNVSGMGPDFNQAFPGWTAFTGGAYSDNSKLPNAVITFADGKLGFFWGGVVYSSANNAQQWNNTTAGSKEFGNFLQMPVPSKIYGIIAGMSVAGNCDFILYSNPLGTPVAERTFSLDKGFVAETNSGSMVVALFSSPYTSIGNQPLAAIVKPTTANNVLIAYNSMNQVAHQKSLTLGTNGYAVNRASGAFAAQNSGKDRFNVGLLVGAFDSGDAGGAGGGVGGIPALRLQLGH